MTRGLKSGGGPDREGGEADAASVGTEVSSPGLAGVGCPTTLEAIDRGQGQAWRGEVCDPDACDISESVFDTGILDDLASELDLGELEAYLALLEPTVTPRLDKMARQLEAEDLDGLVHTAHALAGGSACYGLAALSAVARRIEIGARCEGRDTLARAIAEAAALARDSLAAVVRWRCRLRATRTASLTPSAAAACILTAAAGGT